MSCERYRGWIMDAAAGELPEGRGAKFEEHVRECSPCRQEFQRVRMVLTAIDLGVAAQVAEEPSPMLVEGVRQKIRERRDIAPSWSARWVPMAACATVLILAASVWTLWPGSEARRGVATLSTTLSANRPARPQKIAQGATLVSAPEKRKPMIASVSASVSRSGERRPRRIERQPAAPEVPEVIVPPGQMEAVMQFAEALNSRQIDGAKLLADLKAADQPLEIKPLVIAPLNAPKPSNGEPGDGTPDAARKLVNLQDSK